MDRELKERLKRDLLYIAEGGFKELGKVAYASSLGGGGGGRDVDKSVTVERWHSRVGRDHAPDEPDPDLSLNILRETNRDDSLLCVATASSDSWFWWAIE